MLRRTQSGAMIRTAQILEELRKSTVPPKAYEEDPEDPSKDPPKE